jgi:uncharacterized membrane protein
VHPAGADAHDARVSRGRLEAFSDAVLAIVMTIMVLELAPPEGTGFDDLAPIWPKFFAYLLSFAFLGIYWNNHHHLLQASRTVDGRVLWANMHLLFWLSLIPFGTAWMGEHVFAPTPVAFYGVLLLMPGVAYFFLVRALIRAPGQARTLAEAIGSDFKGKASLVAYAAAIPVAIVAPIVSIAIYVLVAIWWIVPDPRIERRIAG